MPSTLRPVLACLAVIVSGGASRSADLPVSLFSPGIVAQRAQGGGGVRVPLVPIRPVPIRYDIYGYPLPPAAPRPAWSGGCPMALEPDYDPDGNPAGYASVPLCR